MRTINDDHPRGKRIDDHEQLARHRVGDELCAGCGLTYETRFRCAATGEPLCESCWEAHAYGDCDECEEERRIDEEDLS